MTYNDDNDLWAGTTTTALPPGNPFDPNDQPELHQAWNTKNDADRAEAHRQHQAQILNRAVEEATLRLRARRAAEDQLRTETATNQPWPDLIGLDKLLAEDDEPVNYRIDRLWPRHGRIMLAAQFKAGKTTLVANLMRSLVDGVPFLGTYNIEPVTDGTIVLLDTELSRTTLRRWLRDQHYHNPARIVVVPMRGRTATFDLLDDKQRTRWARHITDHDARIVTLDCLGPILATLGLDENKPADVGRFLAGFEALLDEANIDEALIVHHMGHLAERSRGASRLRDWPDAEWKLVRETDENTGEPTPDARRYFSALGRDVGEPEAMLTYDPPTRRLALAGGTRRETKGARHVPTVLTYIETNPDQSLRAIERALAGTVARNDIRAAIRQSITDGTVCTHDGPRNALLHRIKTQCAECAALRHGALSECASAPMGGALHSLPQHQDPENSPGALTHPPTQPERALTSCSICYGPLDDIEQTGHHPTCQPPDTTNNDRDEREWYP